MRVGMTIVTLALLAEVAIAQDRCPTAADLAGGILVSFAHGEQMIYRRGEQPGVVAVDGMSVDGMHFDGRLAQGLYPLSGGADQCEDCAYSYDYGQPPDAMPVPQPSQRIRAEASSAWLGQVTQHKVTYVSGALGTATLGGCQFRVFETAVANEGGPEPSGRVLYLVDLGFAVPADGSGVVGPAGVGLPIRIEAVR